MVAIMGAGVLVLVALLGLLTAGHIGILFVAELDKFLIIENIVLAILYTTSIAGVLKGHEWGYLLASITALFSAGRVSRSVISPRGEVGELALQHIPLLILDLAAGMLALVSI
jgi:hypothetical protein